MAADSNPETKGGAIRRVGKRLLLAGIATVLCLLFAEWIVRIFAGDILPHPSGPRYLYRADPVLGIAHRPGFEGRFRFRDEFDVAIAINSVGCRDDEPADADATRILSLGDSFGFGYGVEASETYANVLERELEQDGGGRFEVINAAASGYGTRHMLEVLRRLGPKLRPKLVLASFFFVNDLNDNVAPLQTERGGIVLEQHFAGQVDESAWLRFSFHWSYLGLLATRAYYNYQFKAQGIDARLGDPIDFGKSWGLDYLRKEPSPAVQQQWQVFSDLVGQLRDEAAKHGARLVMLTIPLEYQIRPAAWQKIVAEQSGVTPASHDPAYPLQRTVDICKSAGVPILELATALRAAKTTDSLYFPINRHFNAAGNRAAAAALARFLRASGLL